MAKSSSSTSVECAAHTAGVTYTCQGHTSLRPNNEPVFSNYQKGDDIEAVDINTLRQVITKELAARRAHIWYRNGKDGTTLKDLQTSGAQIGELIDHPQQNDIVDCVNALNTLINLYDPSDTQLGKKKTALSKVSTDKLIETKDLKEIEEALKIVTTDCICYSDCSSHTTPKPCSCYCGAYSSPCSCYGNCCHYGWW